LGDPVLMQTSQFEAKKVALKQTKDGMVMSLAIHPDEIPDEIVRDFVGARYMVVMVRIGDNEEPVERQPVDKHMSLAAMLCRDPQFWEFLYDQGLMLETNEEAATDWLKTYLNVESRKEIKYHEDAQMLLSQINKEFREWKS
jgi:hypothetical protein